ncbi:MAG: DUF805 domain-containing protein [Cryobacterium sp.]
MVTSRGVRASSAVVGPWVSFTGRTRRAPFWTWTGTVFGLIGLSLALQLIPSSGDGMMWARVAGVLTLLILVVTVVPNLAFLVRRLHDANISGWFVLICVIPGLGGLILLTLAMLPSNPRGRRFDQDGASAAAAPSSTRKKSTPTRSARSTGTHSRSASRMITPAAGTRRSASANPTSATAEKPRLPQSTSRRANRR